MVEITADEISRMPPVREWLDRACTVKSPVGEGARAQLEAFIANPASTPQSGMFWHLFQFIRSGLPATPHSRYRLKVAQAHYGFTADQLNALKSQHGSAAACIKVAEEVLARGVRTEPLSEEDEYMHMLTSATDRVVFMAPP